GAAPALAEILEVAHFTSNILLASTVVDPRRQRRLQTTQQGPPAGVLPPCRAAILGIAEQPEVERLQLTGGGEGAQTGLEARQHPFAVLVVNWHHHSGATRVHRRRLLAASAAGQAEGI